MLTTLLKPDAGRVTGAQAHLALDAIVLILATVAGVTLSALLLPRLAR